MPNLRTLVTFYADFPDDVVEDENDIIEPAGRNVANALSGLLAQKALHPTEVTQHKFYGWAFSTQCRPKYWFLLQCAETWILIIEHRELIAPKQEDQGQC